MTGQQNYFALVKDGNGNPEVKWIRVNQTLQNEIARVFTKQKASFEAGIDTEIEFNGDWKPDQNELLVIDDLAESSLMVNAINANTSSFSDLNISNFTNEPIKAIFTGTVTNGNTTVLVQKFSSRQALSLNEIPIIKMQTGNTFVKSTDKIFTLDNKLVAIIENDTTKFKSFHNARMVFDLSAQYIEATDEDLEVITQHASIEVPDASSFIHEADTQVRKMVHTISSTGVLENYSVTEISNAANNFPSVTINVNNGKIVMPTEKRELKEVLHFLLEDIYKGPLTGSDYLTNSKKSL
ncbi:Kiwa anti-phage protein KwaB-like domain-containing protein [Endozoicomonas sp. ALD040]|uniref:Kiwa anti-phage protein KwaB-like domain-containing protein n=1 Tax=Endozoicomonas sp. ALD040 TaxID=3403079 RepID=UPI003BAFFEE9